MPLLTAPDRYARLRWLSRLRWLALVGVALAGAIGAAGVVPGLNLTVVGLAVALGISSNLYVLWRSRHLGDTDDRHVGQALLDTGALTLVVWAGGGAECPFISFYVFPVLLAALLGGGRAVWPTGAISALGVAFQVAAAHIPSLRIGRWNPTEPWDAALTVVAVVMTVGMAAYFAARFTDTLRQQIHARRQADVMLRLAFEGLGAGLEVIERDHIAWQNPQAERLLGHRLERRWRWPEGTRPLDPGAASAPRQAELVLPGDDGSERIYELLVFPLPDQARLMAIYLDRTTEVLNRRQWMLTERLASLGRTVQGVAHELNTPLATIQTLGRDVLDALSTAELAPALSEDLGESAQMIVDEVQRCRRITHALLGRMEHLDDRAAGEAPLHIAIERAVAVVLPHARDEVQVQLAPDVAEAHFPLDPVVQIFVNLLQNACDVAPAASVTVAGARVADRWQLSVRDRGPGLGTEALAHLFEPFFTTKPPGRGTGLGLYTSYALARGLGGQLALETHPEGGAIARLSLPVSGPSTPAAASA